MIVFVLLLGFNQQAERFERLDCRAIRPPPLPFPLATRHAQFLPGPWRLALLRRARPFLARTLAYSAERRTTATSCWPWRAGKPTEPVVVAARVGWASSTSPLVQQ